MDSMNGNMKKCSFCSEDIPAGAGRCPYCGSLLEVSVEPMQPDFQQQNPEIGQENGPVQPGDGNAAEGTPAEGTQGEETPGEGSAGEGSFTGATTTQSPTGENRTFEQPRPAQGFNRTGYNPPPTLRKPPLSNGLKVFLTLLFGVVPGLGQLAGIITAIVFMNSEDDPDRKSFGVAILVASLVMFVLSCLSCFLVFMVIGMTQSTGSFQP